VNNMPYIKKELRPFFEPIVEQLIEQIIKGVDADQITEKDVAGIITFVTFKLCRRFYQNGKWYDRMDVQKICTSVWDEFNRRFNQPKEDEAIERNGDVE